eukprot:TRINITY_DN30595_c0_g1_i11.p1 TRINITY_DN30595_c0_g1~~TRINITY_DN30595_c0_g1_i11.p1  ORF type:complete len:131 (+),score=1.27 TRINITY_DN30595_c0_g1_i11:97-489(+)
MRLFNGEHKHRNEPSLVACLLHDQREHSDAIFADYRRIIDTCEVLQSAYPVAVVCLQRRTYTKHQFDQKSQLQSRESLFQTQHVLCRYLQDAFAKISLIHPSILCFVVAPRFSVLPVFFFFVLLLPIFLY